MYAIISVIIEHGFGALESSDIFTLMLPFFYPLGVFYNWRWMLGLSTYEEPREKATRYYTVSERNVYHSTNLSAKILRFSIVMTIGWIPGVFKAFKKLMYLKKSVVM